MSREMVLRDISSYHEKNEVLANTWFGMMSGKCPTPGCNAFERHYGPCVGEYVDKIKRDQVRSRLSSYLTPYLTPSHACFITGWAPPQPHSFRCRHYPSSIDNEFTNLITACEHGCKDQPPRWFDNGMHGETT